MPKTIQDLEQLGYTVGIAHGSVKVEEEALAQAKADATADVIGQQVATVTTETIAQLADAGQLPDDREQRQGLASDIAAAALEQLHERATDRVAFHEAAVEMAKTMPDVWVISGPGVTTVYVACNHDGTGVGEEEQAFIDALADPAAHKERCFQAYAPEDVVGLAIEARSLGADVTADATEDSWTLSVDGKNVKTADALEQIVEPLREETAANE